MGDSENSEILKILIQTIARAAARSRGGPLARRLRLACPIPRALPDQNPPHRSSMKMRTTRKNADCLQGDREGRPYRPSIPDVSGSPSTVHRPLIVSA